MIEGPVGLFLIGPVEDGRSGHVAPAHVVGRIPAHAAALGHPDIQQDAAAVPGAEVQRDQVVRLVDGQGNIGGEDFRAV